MISILSLFGFWLLGAAYAGAAVCLIQHRLPLAAPARLPLAFIIWHSTHSIIGLLLAAAHAFSPVWLLGVTLSTYGVVIFLAWLSLPRSALAALLKPPGRSGWTLIACCVLFAGIHLLYARHLPNVSWYYLNQAQDLLTVQAIPSGDFNFGSYAPFEVNKFFTTIQLSFVVALAPDLNSLFTTLALYQAFQLSLYIMLFYALAKVYARTDQRAALATILSLAIPFVSIKFATIRGDGFGILTLMAALSILLVLPIKTYSGLVGAALGALVFHTHPVSGAVFFVFAICLFWSRSAPAWGTFKIGAPALVLIELLLASILGSSLWTVQTDMFASLGSPSNLSAEFIRQVSQVNSETGRLESLAGAAWRFAKDLLQAHDIGMVSQTTSLRFLVLALVFIGGTVAAFRDHRPESKSWLWSLTAIFAGGLFCYVVATERVMATHVWRRELPYLSLFFLLPLARWLPPFKSLYETRTWFFVALAACALSWGLYGVFTQKVRMPAVTEAGEKALHLLAREVSPRDTILADGISAGLFHFWTKGIGMLEGRAPYFQYQLLRHSTASIKAHQQFFRSPTHPFPADWVITGSDQLGITPLLPSASVPAEPTFTVGSGIHIYRRSKL